MSKSFQYFIIYVSSGVRRKFQRGAKFHHNCVMSQINFMGSAEGTTILRGSRGMPPRKVCKITPKNMHFHFCAFWKEVLDNSVFTFLYF